MMGTINVVNRISKKESYCHEAALIVGKVCFIVHKTQSIRSIHSTIKRVRQRRPRSEEGIKTSITHQGMNKVIMQRSICSLWSRLDKTDDSQW